MLHTMAIHVTRTNTTQTRSHI